MDVGIDCGAVFFWVQVSCAHLRRGLVSGACHYPVGDGRSAPGLNLSRPPFAASEYFRHLAGREDSEALIFVL